MTMEFLADGWRFTWARGGSFINVRPAAGSTTAVPYDMAELPEWINVSRMDVDAFETLCLRWARYRDTAQAAYALHRERGHDAPLGLSCACLLDARESA